MKLPVLLVTLILSPFACGITPESSDTGAASRIEEQRANLAKATENAGFGRQSPRHIGDVRGENPIRFSTALSFSEMNLCNIHFHKNAQHAGGEFTQYAGDGDGHGFQSGYVYTGKLTTKERAPVQSAACPSAHDALKSGDTIEVHYVFSSAQVTPGPTLGACLSETNINPQLRVEAQVFVLVNDEEALDFTDLTAIETESGYQQAPNIPIDTGTPIAYAGSTTGPSYNEAGSPLQVSWSVRPSVAKVKIGSVAQWCEGNVFNEGHVHGVRNLVVNTKLLSPIEH
ncbi:MAG: hypothetical protein L7S71_02270 [Pseudomonadales bacterium]|nr:hypothetical protein [Pseudomonadales bacterium]